MRHWLQTYLADLLMIYLVVVLGVHFIVVKDAIDTFAPITFNAIRFSMGALIVAFIGWRNRRTIGMERNDLIFLGIATVIGLAGYQALFVTSLNYTTSTNISLMVATMPTWTAIISVQVGRIFPSRGFSVGLILTLAGVAAVILSSGGEVGMTRDDVLGSSIALFSALLMAGFVVATSHIIDKYGGFTNSIYRHLFTTVGLLVLAGPDLITLTPADFPVDILPNMLYSAFLAGLSGYFISNYAIKKLGPTRFATYNNFMPLVTAVAGILILKEPFSVGLMLGGAMTIVGVAIVRATIHLTPALPPIALPGTLPSAPPMALPSAPPTMQQSRRGAEAGAD